MEKRDWKNRFAEIDAKKRETLRKLAIGTAYAVPTMATFSLDSIRSSAMAQGGYVAPGVLGIVFIPAGAGGLSYKTKAAALAYGSLRITFSHPMKTALNEAKVATGYTCGAGAAVDLSTGWTWQDDTHEVKTVTTPVSGIDIRLNHPVDNWPENKKYESQEGEKLLSHAQRLDTSSNCPP